MSQHGNQSDRLTTDPFSDPPQIRELAKACGLEVVDLQNFHVDKALLARFPAQALFEYRVLPLDEQDGVVRVAVADPFRLEGLDELRARVGRPLATVCASDEQIRSHLIRALGVGGHAVNAMLDQSTDSTNVSKIPEVDETLEPQSASVIALVNELLGEAIKQRASDLHLETNRDQLQVRFRIDGMLRFQPVPVEINRFHSAMISRLKIMANMNIAERRRPQDGRFSHTFEQREFDVRVSVIPMLHGDGVVMRLLDKTQNTKSIESIEMSDDLFRCWDRLIRRPHGLVLVTGPTGSGKTTTLYSSLNAIKSMTTKIITVEDPIEYDLEGINQIQVHEKVGLTFSDSLRSILRHDPDVVLIGEIRDQETASSAIQASLTGHQVLSTLHTNDSTSAYIRLIDMGIEPFLVASTLQGILAQRLVRRLCVACRELYTPEQHQLPAGIAVDDCRSVYRAIGCRECCETGYSGRLAIFELFVPNERTRRLCLKYASQSEVRTAAIEDGLITLFESGWQRILKGETTIDEVMRVCVSDLDSLNLRSVKVESNAFEGRETQAWDDSYAVSDQDEQSGCESLTAAELGHRSLKPSQFHAEVVQPRKLR